jgi:hypothetical protein
MPNEKLSLCRAEYAQGHPRVHPTHIHSEIIQQQIIGQQLMPRKTSRGVQLAILPGWDVRPAYRSLQMLEDECNSLNV